MNHLKFEKDYAAFLRQVKEKIYKAQYDALKKVNKSLIGLYWDIDKLIVNKQEKLGWGKAVVENLAVDLQQEFPGIKGFSAANLWRMRNFYLSFKDDEKLATMSREISWSHNVAIMEKCKDNLERQFYMIMSKKFGWTYRVLVNHIQNRTYENYLLNQTNFDRTLPKKYKSQAKLAVKDEYTFDFLEIDAYHSEKELERSLISNIRRFLIEMGGYFAFIGNQFRLEIDGEEFAIDLLLYHRALRALVAVDLKVGKFKPEYAGKMQFYLSVLDDRVKLADENPSMGIIICQEKNRTIVEYTLKDVNKPIGVGTYKIHKKLPDNLKKYLPSPEEIEKSFRILLENRDKEGAD